MEHFFLHNFFGVDIYEEPDNTWNYEGLFKGKNDRYVFASNELNDKFFKKCKALAFEGSSTTFIWDPIPYDEFIPYQIALAIEHNLMGNVGMTLSQCVQKYEMKSSTSSFSIIVDKFNIMQINIEFGFERKEVQLVMWTSFVKDELIKRAREQYPNRITEDPNKAHLVSKEQFLRNFFGVDIIDCPDNTWTYLGFTDGKIPYYAFHNNRLKNDFFNSCTIAVTTNNGTLFQWGAIPAVKLNFLEVAKIIHQNLLGEVDFSMGDCIRKYSDIIISNKETIRIDFEDYNIKINMNNADETFSMSMWTQLDKTELINKLLK